MPGWFACLYALREAAMKGGLVLVPVIVARRAVYGGLPRSADWLAILLGLPLLHEIIQRSGWIKQLARWYLVDLRQSLGYPVRYLVLERFPGQGVQVGDAIYSGYEGFPIDFTPGEEGRLWGWFATIVLLVLSAVLGFGWKRIPGWAKTGLLWLAGLTWLAGVTYLLSAGLFGASRAISGWSGLPSSIAVPILLGLGSLPEGLLFGVPVVAVLVELRRRANRTWTWTEWLGATTALVALPLGAVICSYPDLINRSDPIALTRLGVQSLHLIAVGLISWFIAKHVGRAGTEACPS
jgi:hypothetical protein